MSLKNIFSFGKNNGNNNDIKSFKIPRRSRKRSKHKQENKKKSRLNIDDFRRGNKQKDNNNHLEGSSMGAAIDHPFVVGLVMDGKIKKSVEEEQNTRKLTLEREEKKKSQLQKLKEEKRCFDLAVLINKNNQYHKILCGPITYEVFYNYLRFFECHEYITNDIKIISKSCQFIEELSGNDIFEYFCNYDADNIQNGVSFRFTDILKIQLFRFSDKNIWTQHKNKQKNVEYDILIIANNQNIPKYVLCDVKINLLSQQIQFKSYHTYETGDIKLLDNIGQKLLDFEITKTCAFYKAERSNLFRHNFNKTTYNSFQFGICYNFNNEQNNNIFYNQHFDIGLLTNENDELLFVMTNVMYSVKNQSISYAECQIYRNGDYPTLKQCGDEIKYITIKQITPIDNKYNFSNAKKCILCNLQNKDLWNAYIGKQKTTEYDIATITDSNNYLCYTLKQVTVNWIDSEITFDECQEYNSIHNQMIKQYGKLMLSNRISGFTIHNRSQFDDQNTLLNVITFYQLNTNVKESTPEPQTPDTPQLTEERSSIYNPINPYASVNSSKSNSIIMNTHKRKETPTYGIPTRPSLVQKNMLSDHSDDYNTDIEIPDAVRMNNNSNNNSNNYTNQHKRKQTATFKIPMRQSTVMTNNMSIDNDLDTKISSSYNNGNSNVNIKSNSHYKTGTTINLTNRDSIISDRMSVLQSMGNVTKIKHQIMQSQNNNMNDNESNKIDKNNKKRNVKIDDELKMVWNTYIDKYGFEPANAEQLKVFSQIQDNIKTLSYFKARNLYNQMKSN